MRSFLLALVLSLPASAQYYPRGGSYWQPTGYIGLGPSSPVNPLARSLDTGWNISGGVGVTQGYVGVNLDAMFNDFGVNHSTLVREGANSGYRRFWAITVDPVVHVNPHGPADFYLTGGAGLYGERIGLRAASTSSNFDLVQTDTVHRFGANGGGGFQFAPDPRSRLKFFLEARVHYMFTPGRGSTFIPVTIGVRF